MIVGRARPERREQLIITHQAQHAVAADRQTQTVMQAGPDLAVALAGKWRGGEVGPDGGEQAGVIDRRPGAAWPGGSGVGRAARLVEGRARHDAADPLHTVGPLS
jgi:hypothetical protein